jgi:anaerobic selenocysteine-containing dehydrogenase
LPEVPPDASTKPPTPTPGTPLQQVRLAKLIIVWGNNATSCNLHLMRHINAAKRNGAKLVVIDARRV